MEEILLISQLKNGDRTAFRELVELFKDKVYNTSLGILQNTSDAEDITQEVFIEVFLSIADFKGNSALNTWIYRIAINKSLELVRRKKTKKRFSFLTSFFSDADPAIEQQDFEHPGVLIENKERSGVLFKAIDKLPENQKTAFILSKVECIPNKEIADIMKVSVSSVESLLHRAKSNLKILLGNFYKNYK